MLDIYCGENALKTLQEHGFKQELFTTMLGASGGPKWFSLFGLDKYLFGEYFKDRSAELNLVGSSAGAFRFAALSQNPRNLQPDGPSKGSSSINGKFQLDAIH